ncbi:hypothetical protein IEQ34_015258 [Dendrobium chrysotoxum]|uniref:Uncharacterized protein n=1 Tax=Dendrobium chrysotoxum TaxID=161865 RepID=A0AAV7GGN2_DENCH|nr:hypothetical protein IEQ34_015258 [Dendrobium chrysotoxum]
MKKYYVCLERINKRLVLLILWNKKKLFNLCRICKIEEGRMNLEHTYCEQKNWMCGKGQEKNGIPPGILRNGIVYND